MDYRLHPLAPALLEGGGVAQQPVEHLLKGKQHKPDKDMRVQRAPPLCLNLATSCQNKAEEAQSVAAGCASIRTPLLSHAPHLASTETHTFGTDAQRAQEEQADHELEDNRLRHRILGEAIGHLSVSRQFCVHVDLLALHHQ